MIDELAAASGQDVSRETFERLQAYVGLLLGENQRQNLIARSTSEQLWSRHVVDSAQLLRFAPDGRTRWLDVGSGAGLPGMVIAILSSNPIVLVEPRKLRADFLQRCVGELKLSHCQVHCTKVERETGQFDVITARAVAPADKLFGIARHLSHSGTRWILPKGQSGAKELAEVRRAWQGRFSIQPSITDENAVILVADGVMPRGGASR
jgi:16S rRNA (guanine527-N7)-methyltransferase